MMRWTAVAVVVMLLSAKIQGRDSIIPQCVSANGIDVLTVSSVKRESIIPDAHSHTVGFILTLWRPKGNAEPPVKVKAWSLSAGSLSGDVGGAYYDAATSRAKLLFGMLNESVLVTLSLDGSQDNARVVRSEKWPAPAAPAETIGGYRFSPPLVPKKNVWECSRSNSASGRYVLWTRGRTIEVLDLAGASLASSIHRGLLPPDSWRWFSGPVYEKVCENGKSVGFLAFPQEGDIPDLRVVQLDSGEETIHHLGAFRGAPPKFIPERKEMIFRPNSWTSTTSSTNSSKVSLATVNLNDKSISLAVLPEELAQSVDFIIPGGNEKSCLLIWQSIKELTAATAASGEPWHFKRVSLTPAR